MTDEEKQMKNVAHWVHWVIATTVAAFTIIAYINSYVYPRADGEKLEKRVDQVENYSREELREMRQKLDRIYEILLKLERRP